MKFFHIVSLLFLILFNVGFALEVQITSFLATYIVSAANWFQQIPSIPDLCAQPKYDFSDPLNSLMAFGSCTSFEASPQDYLDCESQDTSFDFYGNLGSTSTNHLKLGKFVYSKKNETIDCYITGGIFVLTLQLNNQTGLAPNSGEASSSFTITYGENEDFIEFDFSNVSLPKQIPYMEFKLVQSDYAVYVRVELALSSDPEGNNLIFKNRFLAPANQPTEVYLNGIITVVDQGNTTCKQFSVGDVTRGQNSVVRYIASVDLPQGVVNNNVTCEVCTTLLGGSQVEISGVPNYLPVVQSASNCNAQFSCMNYNFINSENLLQLPVTFDIQSSQKPVVDVAGALIESLTIKCTGALCFECF